MTTNHSLNIILFQGMTNITPNVKYYKNFPNFIFLKTFFFLIHCVAFKLLIIFTQRPDILPQSLSTILSKHVY